MKPVGSPILTWHLKPWKRERETEKGGGWVLRWIPIFLLSFQLFFSTASSPTLSAPSSSSSSSSTPLLFLQVLVYFCAFFLSCTNVLRATRNFFRVTQMWSLSAPQISLNQQICKAGIKAYSLFNYADVVVYIPFLIIFLLSADRGGGDKTVLNPRIQLIDIARKWIVPWDSRYDFSNIRNIPPTWKVDNYGRNSVVECKLFSEYKHTSDLPSQLQDGRMANVTAFSTAGRGVRAPRAPDNHLTLDTWNLESENARKGDRERRWVSTAMNSYFPASSPTPSSSSF